MREDLANFVMKLAGGHRRKALRRSVDMRVYSCGLRNRERAGRNQ